MCISSLNRPKSKIRNVSSWLPLSILCLAVFSCASLLVLPAPKGEEDTLLVIVTEQHMDAQAAYLITWELKLDTMDKPVIIRPWEKYALVSGLTPGNHLSTTLTIMPVKGDASWYTKGDNKPVPQSFPVPFVMKPGTCTVFPFKFIYQMKVDAGAGTGRTGYRTQPLTVDDQREMVEGMKNLKNFTLWKTE